MEITLLFIVLLVLFTRRIIIRGICGLFASKGNLGEIHVSYILSHLPIGYHVFNDVYINNNGYTSQIDHIVVSQFGIFIIETKNYSGAVYGSENAEYWTQYLQGKGCEFYNPIQQNHSHVLAIQKTLHVTQKSIFPIVVFVGECDLHCKTTTPVLYSFQLKDFILRQKTMAFSSDGVERLVQKLSESIDISSERNSNHVRNVRQNVIKRELQVANHICPQCGGKLEERNGKYGRFLGCSNYPHCKFTTKR